MPPERPRSYSVITDMLDGQYSDPVRVVGFNTSEGWARRAGRHPSARTLTERRGMPRPQPQRAWKRQRKPPLHVFAFGL
jgi:hypothetical protein